MMGGRPRQGRPRPAAQLMTHMAVTQRPPVPVPWGLIPSNIPHSQQHSQVPPGVFHQPMVVGGTAPAPPFRSQPFPPSLPELTQQLRTNSYSTAGVILLRVLDHFFGVLVLGGDRTSLQPTETMLQLLDEYILRLHPKRKVESLPRVTALEELRLVNSLRVYVEGPADKSVKLCVIDAVFGSESDAVLDPAKLETDIQHNLLCKLASLAISTGNKDVLDVVAFWMRRYPERAAVLAHQLYLSFCEHLPDALAPFRRVAEVSPQFVCQMCLAFTKTYPIYNDDSPHKVQQPPLKLVPLVADWLRQSSEAVFALDSTSYIKEKSLPLRRRRTKVQSGIQALLPIEGLFSWAILSPLLEVGGSDEEMDTSNRPTSPSYNGCSSVQQTKSMEENGGVEGEGEEPCRSRKQVYSCLHSYLLEVLVSDASSKSSAGTHPVDMGVFERVSGQLNSLAEHQDTNCRADELEVRMEEAINRLAQILQVCLSNKLLPSPSMSEAINLVNLFQENRLLSLVLMPFTH